MNAFELRRLEPTCARIAEMARQVMETARAEVVLVCDGVAMLPNGEKALAVRADANARVASGAPLWLSDRTAEAGVDNGLADPWMKFIAAAPIMSADGWVLGALCVMDGPVRPFDAMCAEWLSTLAQAVASDCEASGAAAKARPGAGAMEALIDAAPVALAMTDARLRCLRYSPRWVSEMGLAGREIIGRSIYELFPTAEASYASAFERALGGETVGAEAIWAQLPDGRRACLRCEIAPWRTVDGEVGGVLFFAIDLAEMHEALERSRRVERRLKIATEIADVHVWEADYENREVINEGARDTFFEEPLTFEELQRDPFNGVHPDDRERVMADFMKSVETGGAYRSEYRVARSDGAEIWAASAVEAEMGPDGEPIRVIGTLQNITARKKAEQEMIRARDMAEAASRAKSEFLATISHEIRTPLNGVLGMAQAMAADSLSPSQRERLKVLHRSGEALLALLNDVLDLAKIESGKMVLEAAVFDLEQLCQGATAAYAVLAESKDVRLTLEFSKAAKGSFRGDATRLRQILHNLLSNAIKFTAEGQVAMSVRAEGRNIVFSVRDTGIGIAADKLAGLFDKFVQADASTTRKFGGSGLGLAIARDLAEMMGGGIIVESQEGQGSTFTVKLPMTRAKGPARAPRPARRTGRQEMRRALRILAAEDNEVNQLVLKTLLNQAGVEPTVVPDGAQAVAAWETGEWDAILMDIHMPVMDGVSAARLIREREAAQGRRRTPIIALTANAMNHQIADYAAAGMGHVVSKPLEVGRFFETLELALAECEAADETRAAG